MKNPLRRSVNPSVHLVAEIHRHAEMNYLTFAEMVNMMIFEYLQEHQDD